MGRHTHWMLTVQDEAQTSFSAMLACGDKVVVGRSRVCEIMLADQTISRKHCMFGVGGDGALRLTDLGARHPAVVDGVAVEAGCSIEVPDGAGIRLGRGLRIQAECLGDKPRSSVEGGGSEADGMTREAHTKGFGNPAPDDVGGTPDTSDEQQPVPAAPPAADAPGPQDETRMLEPTRPGAQRRFDASPQPQTCEVPKNADQNDHAILGKTLQGKLLQPKKSGPTPGKDDAGVNGGGATEGPQPEADAQDKTNYIDPSELQELMEGKSVEAADDCEADDKTNYIDPAELQKLVKGKAGSFGRKKGGTPQRGVEAEGADDGDAQDKTNYIDPAELKKLVKGKGKPHGSGRGRSR